jgi:hypothetical protein
MKLWVTLIVSTILITAIMTYLVLHRGAQTLAEPGSVEESSLPSRVEFPGGTIEGNVLDIDGGASRPGRESSVVVPLKCTGSAPLKLELLRVSCTCANALFLNDRKLEEGRDPVTLQPGESATLKINWTPKDEQGGNPAYRFSASFLLNDPRYSHTFRIQITTRILPKEGKP